MTTIYFKDENGRKVYVEVTEEFAEVYQESRLVIERNDDKEEYHRDKKLGNLGDCDGEFGSDTDNPEAMRIAAEEQAEAREGLTVGLRSLTAEQLALVKMLKSGMTVTEIAAKLGVSKSAVSNMRIRIQEKIKKYLK